MSRRIHHRRSAGPGGWFLTAAVVVLAAAACLLLNPPTLPDVASVFGKATTAPAAAEAIVLPARDWYLVEANSQTVAAYRTLLEAELLRESHGAQAEIRRLSTEEVTLDFTASAAQLAVLKRCADAITDTFDTLERMSRLSPYDAANAAVYATLNLDDLMQSVEKNLSAVSNPVVRGLSGLAGSCREAMAELSKDASLANVKSAALAQQYAAYVTFLGGQ